MRVVAVQQADVVVCESAMSQHPCPYDPLQPSFLPNRFASALLQRPKVCEQIQQVFQVYLVSTSVYLVSGSTSLMNQQEVDAWMVVVVAKAKARKEQSVALTMKQKFEGHW